MDKKNTKSKRPHLQLVISILVATAFILAEVYVMINQPSNIILMIGSGVLVLISVYFVVDAVMNAAEAKEAEAKERYDTIFRSEKISYTLLRKNLDEIRKSVEESDHTENANQREEIVNSQKAITKIAMNKSKEETESVLAAINELYQKITELEEKTGDGRIEDERQKRLFIELHNLEASVNDHIQSISEKLSGFQEEIERLAEHIAKINKDAIHQAMRSGAETGEEDEFDEITDETVVGENDEIPETFVEEPEELMSEDELNALLESVLSDTSVEEETAEADAQEEPQKEEKMDIPDLSDPNKVMSPEEIAALIANM